MKSRTEDLDEIIETILDRVVPGMLRVNWRTHHLAQNVGIRDSNRFTDAGTVIERIEPWSPGERVDDIASAATGWTELITTVYRDETPLDIVVIADASVTMEFGSERVSIRILAAEIQAGINAAAQQRCDNIGAISYSDTRVESRLALQPARRELLQEALWLYLSAEPNSTAAKPVDESGLVEALTSLPSSRRCLVFVLSDFGNLSQGDIEALSQAACRHDVCCVLLSDRRVEELPPGVGVRVLRYMRTQKAQVFWLTRRGRQQWQDEYQCAHKALLAQLTETCGCRVWQFRTGEDPVERLTLLLAGETE